MSQFESLKIALNDILQVIKPLREDWEIRFQIINEIRVAVSSVESLRGAIVEPFGSFASNLFTRVGDLDISIELPNGSHISSAAKRLKQRLLGDVLRVLRQNGGWYKLQFIPHARVPILKSVSNRQGISCDMSIDNLAGLMKSRFLFWISEIDGRFRDMVLLVKEWAKAHDINNSKTGTLNSYSLTMLVIFHFQTCVPAIIPPLQEIYAGNMVDDLVGVRDDTLRRISESCAAQIARLKSDKSRTINRSSLSELFISFFAKFSALSSKASQLGICPYRGQWEDIGGNTRWQPKTYALFIEDPLEQPENTARSVGARQLERISEAFQMTYNNLNSENRNLITILSTLATQKTSSIVERTRANYHSPNGFARPKRMMTNHSSNQVGAEFNAAARTSIPVNGPTRTPVGQASYTHHNKDAFARFPVGDSSKSYSTSYKWVHHSPQLYSAQQQGKGTSYKTNHQQVCQAPSMSSSTVSYNNNKNDNLTGTLVHATHLNSAPPQGMPSLIASYNNHINSDVLPRTPVSDPGTSYLINQQVNFRPQLYSAQQQGMSSRPGNSLNLLTQVRTTGVGQQIWRPKSGSNIN